MTRLIEADALFINLDGMMAVSPTGYIHGDTVADMISDAPTVDAIPIEWMLKWDDAPLTDESKEIGSTVNWNIVKWMILEWRKEHDQIDK